MNVSSALRNRKSIRAFKPEPVPQETLQSIFQLAIQSPSNCNVQPWQVYVASGDTLKRLSSTLIDEITSGTKPYPSIDWQVQFKGDMQDRKYASAAALYDAMGIARDDKIARKTALLRNWEFFGAPHAVFFTMERSLGLAGAVDLGIFAQAVSLLAQEHGVASCFQAALNQFPGPILREFNIPASRDILFGMSLGYADDAAAVNETVTERENVEKLVQFFD